MANILRVNLTSKAIYSEAVPDRYSFLGGRGLTSQIISDEVNPACDALGESNKLVIAPGLLAGTPAPCSGRLSIGAKSPLTGGIKESNAGGTVARKLSNLGIKAIILEGKAEGSSWHVLKIAEASVMILPADDVEGLGNYESVGRLRAAHGPKVGILSIGPGGERQMGAATIAVTDQEGRPCRHCGRGGLGAVMGSKGIKAIVIDDRRSDKGILDIADPGGFKDVSHAWAKAMVETKKGLTHFGTAALVTPVNAAGGLPTRNYSRGDFEGAERINGSTLADTLRARGGRAGHACSPGCVIRCSNIYHDRDGDYLTAGLEYETIALMGSNLGIDSLDIIAALDRRCDDYGLDTMEMGNAIGIAMEAGIASFGDGAAAVRLLDEVKAGTGIGRILGQGAATAGRALGISRVAAVKGQGMAAYDPRALKGTGVTYATSPMGADHTAGNLLPGRAGVDCHSPDGQIKASRDLQIMSTVLDVMGLCLFVGPLAPEMETISRLLTKVFGKTFGVEDVLEIGRAVLRTELTFNQASGMDSSNDRLPEFFSTERLPPNGLLFDVPNGEIDQVHAALHAPKENG
ncbi:MAG: aldehyde ferredoxin oxidoreductase [Deltaproteobacteria bacterium]|nr:aldehyde ferredoxin oxidoreductase [Deltaproteobacteria bacterium]